MSPVNGAVAGLDIHPPQRVAVGRGSAFVIGGYCYHRSERTRSLAIQVGDSRQPVEHFRMPRADVFDGLEEGDPARPQAYRSGFVAMLDLAPVDRPAEVSVTLVLTLNAGRETTIPVGTVQLDPVLTPPDDAVAPAFRGGGPPVAICMATYNPPEELLHRQLDSIREQTHENWICFISDDGSEPEALEGLTAAIEGDPRFVLSRSDEHLGFYRNFERAMSMAPPAAEFVTLCDQDDRWYPEKLERLLAAMGDAQLVYSDARVVNPAGEVILPSYWTVRRTNYTNFASLLLANTVTGAASLFRRELLDDVLPLPPRLDAAFHDHWIAIVAMARGRISFVEEPLYDYVQHDRAVIGHSQANRTRGSIPAHLRKKSRRQGDAARIAYYYKWHQHLIFDEVLRLRSWDRMSRSKRRTLRRLLSADRGVAGLVWLLGRRARRLWGRNETLDRELAFVYALVRRRGVSASALGRKRPTRLLHRDASIPPAPPAY